MDPKGCRIHWLRAAGGLCVLRLQPGIIQEAPEDLE